MPKSILGWAYTRGDGKGGGEKAKSYSLYITKDVLEKCLKLIRKDIIKLKLISPFLVGRIRRGMGGGINAFLSISPQTKLARI